MMQWSYRLSVCCQWILYLLAKHSSVAAGAFSFVQGMICNCNKIRQFIIAPGLIFREANTDGNVI